MENPRVVIIGAGPAGIRCAETLVKQGIKPVVVDEQQQSGGQIYKRQPKMFKRPVQELYGTEFKKAQSVHQAFDAIIDKITYYANTTVWAIEHKTLYVHQNDKPLEIEFDYLILCTGATDRVLPINGWELPGTYSLGGAQIALKHQACSIGEKVAFIGTGPLLYLVAYQYLKAGANVAGVFDTSDFSSRVKAMDKLLAKPFALLTGLKMIAALKKAKVPVMTGITPKAIRGDKSVNGLTLEDAHNRTVEIDCDAVALGFHIKPETQLADLAGCQFKYDETSQLWLPEVNDQGETSVDYVFSAGDGCRILGADAAELSGQVAAWSILNKITSLNNQQQKRYSKLQSRFKRLKRFGEGLAQAFPWPSHLINKLIDDTVVCRCEMVTKAEIKLSVNSKEASEVNRSKSFSRVGMGRCQGRYCAHVNAQIIADEKQQPLQTSGRQRSQAPAKPIPINVYVSPQQQDV